MKKLIRHLSTSLLALAGVYASPFSASAQLFTDNFQTNTASSWSIFGGSSRAGITNDYKVVFATNYTQLSYSVFGTPSNIPPSPNSTEGTNSRGLFVTANKATVATSTSSGPIAGVSLYPNGKNFSGNYSLRFDMFMNYNGGQGGGSGSTEMSTYGINHLGTKVNWYSIDPVFVGSQFPGDGVWFWADGENGTSLARGNWRALVGDPTPGPSTPVAGGLLYEPGADYANPNGVTAQIFPVPPAESWGAPGKQWVQVEIRQQNGFVTWLMNGFVCGYHSTLNGFTSGNIMLGYLDPVKGTANPPEPNFVIYDNVQVASLGATEIPTVSLVATQPNATKPGTDSSQYGTFTISRKDATGSPVSPASPLTVYYTITGTAVNGSDYVLIPGSVTIPSGQSETNLLIKPTSLIKDPSMTVSLRLVRPAGVYTYEMRNPALGSPYQDTVTITDARGVPSVNVEAYKPVAYGKYRAGRFNLTTAATFPNDVTINYTLTGTATNGVDYVTTPSSAILPAGNTNVFVNITPTGNNLSSNRTAILTIGNGAGYRAGTSSNATVTLRHFAPPAGTPKFNDPLDSDTSANWNVNKSQESDIVTFNYDYSADGIPSAPGAANNTTKGVKLQANVSAAARAGLSLSPKGGNFTNDYRLRFDFWLNYNGSADFLNPGISRPGAEATMWFGAGVGTTGVRTNWDNGQADGIWFDSNNDGSSTISADFEAYRGPTQLLLGSPENVWIGNSQAASSAYYAEFGRETAPASQQAVYPAEQSGISPRGTLAFAWHDMLIVKQGTNVTWYIDGLPIANVGTNGTSLSTNVFITYYDGTAAVNLYSDVSFALIDNVRVEGLAPATPPTISVARNGSNLTLTWSGSGFTLQQASSLTGSPTDWSNVGGAASPYVTSAASGIKFYRLKQ